MSSKRRDPITCLAFVALLAAPLPEAAPPPAHGASGVAPPTPRSQLGLHLEDALRLAMTGNWDLLSSRTDVAIAEARLRGARGRPNPVVSALTAGIHLDGRADGTQLGNDFWSRAYDNVIQASQLVEVGGKRSARVRSEASGAEAARARYADNRRALQAVVVQSYVAVALAEAKARIARQSSGYLGDEARLASLRWRAGDISKSDLSQIEIAAARLELDAESAEAEARARRVALEVLLGVPRPAGDVVVVDSLEVLADQSSLVPPRSTGGERADVAAARAELRRAESELRLQRALRIPDPTIILQFEHRPPDRPNTIGAGVSFPLPIWNRNGSGIGAAEAARDEAARVVRRVEAQVASDVAVARAGYDEALSRWRRYRDELRPRSAEVRGAVSLVYERGGASLLDLLQAQRSDNDVRLAAMQAASDAAVAAAALKSVTEAVTMEEIRR